MDLKTKKNRVMLLGIITVVLIIVYLVIGTQSFAYMTKYNKALGSYISVGEVKIYNPLKIIEWEKKYKKKYPRKFKDVADYQLIGCMSIVIVLIIILKKRRELTEYGTARFSTEDELKGVGYIAKWEANTKKDDGLSYSDGVILSRTKSGKTIIDNEKTHLLVLAPTRSGKGVGTIIPTLLNWRESCLVFDIKGENYSLTGGFRKKLGQKVLRFAPLDWDDCVSYNPLGEIRVGTIYEYSDTQIITDIIVWAEEGKANGHWELSAQALLNGAILHILYKKRQEGKIGSLGDIIDFFKNPKMTMEEILTEARDDSHILDLNTLDNTIKDKEGKTARDREKELFKSIYSLPIDSMTHPKVANAMADAVNKAENERASVISTLLAKLVLFENPIIRKNTTKTEFKIKDLMDNCPEYNHKSPISLYCVVPPNEIDSLAPLLRLIVAQVIGGLTGEMDMGKDKQHDYRLLMLLDEFNAIGKIDLLERALAFVAGYGIKVMMIVQSVNQLKKTYGDKNQITDNCHCKMYYAPNDKETPKEIAEMLGKTTILTNSHSWKGIRLLDTSISESLTGRDLMTSGEVATMDNKTSLVFVTGIHAHKSKKIRYYEEPYFLNKTKIPKLEKSDIVRKEKKSSKSKENNKTITTEERLAREREIEEELKRKEAEKVQQKEIEESKKIEEEQEKKAYQEKVKFAIEDLTKMQDDEYNQLSGEDE